MSKELFFNMRAEEMASLYDASFTKKEAKQQGVNLVKEILDNGNATIEDLCINIVRLKEVINSADAEVRKHLPEENFEHMGVKFSHSSGGDTVNYKDDEVWADLKKQMTQRQELLKTALKSDKPIYDDEGVEVPKVSTTPRKSSIRITF